MASGRGYRLRTGPIAPGCLLGNPGGPGPPAPVGDPSPPPGLGRVSGRAQREESPPARGQGGAAGRRGSEPEAPQADPQRHHRRGHRGGDRGDRLPGLRQQQQRGLPVQRGQRRPPPSPPRRRPTPSSRPRRTRWRSRRAARPARRPDGCNTQKYIGRPGHDHRHVQDLHGDVRDHHAEPSTSPRCQRPPRRRSTTSCSWPTRAIYNCVIFHRVIPGFMDQTGDPTRTTGRASPATPSRTSSRPRPPTPAQQYPLGPVAMANTGQPNSGGSQFFIVAGPQGEALPNSVRPVRPGDVRHERGRHHQQPGLRQRRSRPT